MNAVDFGGGGSHYEYTDQDTTYDLPVYAGSAYYTLYIDGVQIDQSLGEFVLSEPAAGQLSLTISTTDA